MTHPEIVLIKEFKNDFNPADPTKNEINLEVIPVDSLDRLQKCVIFWVFGDGSEVLEIPGTIGQRIGFKQSHTYPKGEFFGQVVLALEAEDGNLNENQTVEFNIIVTEGEPMTLKLFLERIISPNDPPLLVTMELVGNQAFENISVDWGDGTPLEFVNPGSPSTILIHDYANFGSFNVSVNATSKANGDPGFVTKLITLSDQPDPIGDQNNNLLIIGGVGIALALVAAYALTRKR